MLVTRGPGGHGKDVLANRVATLLGTYFVNLACEALASCRGLDSPSQIILGLRCKRFVCIRELAKDATIWGHIYRTIADPKNNVKARGLYGKDQEFHPHYLLFACTNVPSILRTRAAAHNAAHVFSICRIIALMTPWHQTNGRQILTSRICVIVTTPRFISLLTLVLKTILANPANRVSCVPDEFLDAAAEELEDPWEETIKALVHEHIEPTAKPAFANTAA